MREEEYRPGAESRELTAFEQRTLLLFQQLKESLQWKDGQPPDPYKVHQKLAVIAREGHPHPGEEEPPDHEAFTENMAQIRNAFCLVAYPYMSEDNQLTLRRMYQHHEGEELSITPQQKRMLTMITTAAGIPNHPLQLTYSYSAVFRPGVPGNGQVKVRR